MVLPGSSGGSKPVRRKKERAYRDDPLQGAASPLDPIILQARRQPRAEVHQLPCCSSRQIGVVYFGWSRLDMLNALLPAFIPPGSSAVL